MTPCRLMTLQLRQIFFTDALTFIGYLRGLHALLLTRAFGPVPFQIRLFQ